MKNEIISESELGSRREGVCVDLAGRRVEGPDRLGQVGRGLVLRVLVTGGAARRLWRKRGPGWRGGSRRGLFGERTTLGLDWPEHRGEGSGWDQDAGAAK